MAPSAAVFLSVLLLCSVAQTYSSTACFLCVDKDGSNAECRRNPEHMKYVTNCKQQPSNVLKDFLDFNEDYINLASEDSFKCIIVQTVNITTSVFVRACIPSYLYCSKMIANSIIYPTNGHLDGCKVCETDLCNFQSL